MITLLLYKKVSYDHRDPTFRALDSQNSAWRAKINFFFHLYFLDSRDRLRQLLLPSSIFFPNVVLSTGLSETKIMYPLNKKAYDIIHLWLRLTCSAKFYQTVLGQEFDIFSGFRERGSNHTN